jgi:CheY-like chemotaxis protein
MSEKKHSILVVEDDEQSQRYMSLLLSQDYDVRVVACGRDAMQALDDRRVDLILMDLSLRDGEDGLQVTQRIRQSVPHAAVPIIALTAHAFPEDRKRSLAAGCDDYVAKPFQWRYLRSVMESHLDR